MSVLQGLRSQTMRSRVPFHLNEDETAVRRRGGFYRESSSLTTEYVDH